MHNFIVFVFINIYNRGFIKRRNIWNIISLYISLRYEKNSINK